MQIQAHSQILSQPKDNTKESHFANGLTWENKAYYAKDLNTHLYNALNQ